MGDDESTPPQAAIPPPRRRRWLRLLWDAIGVLAVLGLLLVAALWLGWPAVSHYPEEVSRWLSRGVGQRVSIDSIEAQWEGISPRLTLRGVTLFDPQPGQGERALARFESLDVLIDPWASIRSTAFRPSALTVHGASLMVIRHPDGSLEIHGLSEDPELESGPDALAQLFLEHARVSVRSGRLLWVDRSVAGQSVSIHDVDLHLRRLGVRRRIDLSGEIDQPGSGRFDVVLEAHGDLLTPNWSGEVRLRADDLDLGMAARLAGVARDDFVQGRAALEVSSQWRDGRMESARGHFGLSDSALRIGIGRAGAVAARGSLEITGDQGTFRVDSASFDWEWEDVFREPVAISAFSGTADWRRDGDLRHAQLREAAFETAHVSGSLEGSLGWDGVDGEPLVAVRLALSRAELAHLPLYLPVGVLPPKLVAWIERAVHGGHLEEGELRIEGALRDWPFDEGEGSVSARARVSGVELRYAPGWPAIGDLAAELRFEGRHAAFELSEGRVQGAEISGATVDIPHVGEGGTTLTIDGHLSGTTEQAAEYLRNSPLAPRFMDVLDAVRAQGPASLALQIAIPLPRGTKRVSGRLEVQDNHVDPPGLEQGLDAVAGAFDFEGATINAEEVRAVYLGRPITLQVSPSETEGGVRIAVEGTTTREHLAAHLRNAGLLEESNREDPAWLSRLSGETGWRSVFDVEKGRNDHEMLASVRIASDLRGARIDLPPPLAKAPSDTVGLDIGLELGGEGARTVRARYGELLSTVFVLRDARREGPRLERGSLRLGGGEAELPDGPGVSLSGTLPRLSLGRWMRLLGSRTESEEGAQPATPSVLAALRRVNLQVEELDAFGVPFGTTRIDAQVDPSSAWTASLVGANILGEIRVPAGPEPVLVHMDRLIVPAGDEREGAPAPDLSSSPNPTALPAIRFTCSECKLADHELGTVDIVTQPDPQGTRIPSFYMRGEGYEARGSGAWLVADGVPASSVDAQVHSNDLGRLLDTFGHVGGESITGATDMLLRASWPGSPFRFDLGRLDGVLHFRASEGRLTQVRRGATGRFFALLMLPSLPRRLALDFRDLFQEGLAFDLMEGSFVIDSGDAYTNNFVMESPTATIELAGRTGLIDEDYDHVLTLTPKLTENIALLPIWLGERILNTRVFDRVFAHRYSIRGPWTAPRVEPIQVDADQAERE